MEIKVNDYVRTKWGEIAKIKKFAGTNSCGNLYQLDIKGENNLYCEGNIIKSSPNIIDLIEVGDYVNSMRVSELLKRGKKETKYIRFMADSDYEFSTELKEEEIETILTKEMFEQMEYKLD